MILFNLLVETLASLFLFTIAWQNLCNSVIISNMLLIFSSYNILTNIKTLSRSYNKYMNKREV